MRIWILGHQSLRWAGGLSRALWVLGTGWRVAKPARPARPRQPDRHGTHGLPQCLIHDHRATCAIHWHVLASTQPRGGSMVGPVTLVWNQWRRETGAVERGGGPPSAQSFQVCVRHVVCASYPASPPYQDSPGPLKPEPPTLKALGLTEPEPEPEHGVSHPLSRCVGAAPWAVSRSSQNSVRLAGSRWSLFPEQQWALTPRPRLPARIAWS